MGRKIIALVEGGFSHEEQVSLKSATNVYQQLNHDLFEVFRIRINKDGWNAHLDDRIIPVDKNDFSIQTGSRKINFDAVFMMIHGTPGEDGKLQAYFEMLDIPVTTGNSLAAALSFSKYACNKYLQAHGIPIAKSKLLLSISDFNQMDVLQEIGLPCFVKPNDGGSSFGTTKVSVAEKLKEAVELAFQHGKEVLVEAFLAGKEVTNGVYKDKNGLHVLPITEIKTDNEFFDFNAKYMGQSQEITPADLPEQLTKQIQQTTLQVYRYLNLRGIARVDYIITEKGAVLLEVNTVPGQSVASIIPQQAKVAGIQISELYQAVLEDCFR
ncbi:MAG: D-alanine--D-alanine ligase [Flavobacteriales bacterium]